MGAIGTAGSGIVPHLPCPNRANSGARRGTSWHTPHRRRRIANSRNVASGRHLARPGTPSRKLLNTADLGFEPRGHFALTLDIPRGYDVREIPRAVYVPTSWHGWWQGPRQLPHHPRVARPPIKTTRPRPHAARGLAVRVPAPARYGARSSTSSIRSVTSASSASCSGESSSQSGGKGSPSIRTSRLMSSSIAPA